MGAEAVKKLLERLDLVEAVATSCASELGEDEPSASRS